MFDRVLSKPMMAQCRNLSPKLYLVAMRNMTQIKQMFYLFINFCYRSAQSSDRDKTDKGKDNSDTVKTTFTLELDFHKDICPENIGHKATRAFITW